MSLANALALAKKGFHVFPVVAGGKLPAIEGFPEKATRDPAMLRSWFQCSVMGHDHGHNVGIYTGRFGDDPNHSLCVIDVDDKDGKNGSAELAKLLLPLPSTYIQHTPTGGRHLVFTTTTPVANNASKLAPGIDIRGTGGFIVGAGSVREGLGAYTADDAAVAPAPPELLALCSAHMPRSPSALLFDWVEDLPETIAAAAAYLRNAPPAVEGSGNDTAYRVACRVKDIGLSEQATLDAMMSHWNDRCAPPWDVAELAGVVANAYAYGKSQPGIAAPAAGVNDAQTAVAALAALSPLEYESRRKAEAARLGLRAPALDAAVRAARPAKADDVMAALFPIVEPWPNPVAGAELLDEIRTVFVEYMTLPPQAAEAIALWVLWTYVFDEHDTAPFLFLSSPTPSCGKSTCMKLAKRMAFRPLMTSGTTTASLFRIIDIFRPTLLIDEADTFAKDNEELRGVLNSGHEREGAFVTRVVGEGADLTPKLFSTWAPKMLAAIGSLPGTVESRSIIVRLQRRLVSTAAPRLGRRQFVDIQRKAVRWAVDKAPHVRAYECQNPDWLGDRAFDSWLPLFAVADAAGGAWPQQALAAARELSGTGAVDPVAAGGTGVELLRDIREVFAEVAGKDTDAKLPTADLIHRLCGDEGARWCEYFKGHRITPAQVARLLKPFGIASKGIRMADGATPKGYRLAQFGDAFSRYLVASEEFVFQVALSMRPVFLRCSRRS